MTHNIVHFDKLTLTKWNFQALIFQLAEGAVEFSNKPLWQHQWVHWLVWQSSLSQLCSDASCRPPLLPLLCQSPPTSCFVGLVTVWQLASVYLFGTEPKRGPALYFGFVISFFSIFAGLSAFLYHSEAHAGTSSKCKHRFESVMWCYRVNSVLSLFPSERRLICTINTFHVSTRLLMVHQGISKPVNQPLPRLQIKQAALWKEAVKAFTAGVFSCLMGCGLSKELI